MCGWNRYMCLIKSRFKSSGTGIRLSSMSGERRPEDSDGQKCDEEMKRCLPAGRQEAIKRNDSRRYAWRLLRDQR